MSAVAVAFQSVFYVEIHQNNIFLFLKIIFKISISKQFKTYKKINLKKNKYFKNMICIAFSKDNFYFHDKSRNDARRGIQF